MTNVSLPNSIASKIAILAALASASTRRSRCGGTIGRRNRSAAGGNSTDPRRCSSPITTMSRAPTRSKPSARSTPSRATPSWTLSETTTSSAASSIIPPLARLIPIESPCTANARCRIIPMI